MEAWKCCNTARGKRQLSIHCIHSKQKLVLLANLTASSTRRTAQYQRFANIDFVAYNRGLARRRKRERTIVRQPGCKRGSIIEGVPSWVCRRRWIHQLLIWIQVGCTTWIQMNNVSHEIFYRKIASLGNWKIFVAFSGICRNSNLGLESQGIKLCQIIKFWSKWRYHILAISCQIWLSLNLQESQKYSKILDNIYPFSQTSIYASGGALQSGLVRYPTKNLKKSSSCEMSFLGCIHERKEEEPTEKYNMSCVTQRDLSVRAFQSLQFVHFEG